MWVSEIVVVVVPSVLFVVPSCGMCGVFLVLGGGISVVVTAAVVLALVGSIVKPMVAVVIAIEPVVAVGGIVKPMVAVGTAVVTVGGVVKAGLVVAGAVVEIAGQSVLAMYIE